MHLARIRTSVQSFAGQSPDTMVAGNSMATIAWVFVGNCHACGGVGVGVGVGAYVQIGSCGCAQ